MQRQILLQLATRFVKDVDALGFEINHVEAQWKLTLLEKFDLLHSLSKPSTDLILFDAERVCLPLELRLECKFTS